MFLSIHPLLFQVSLPLKFFVLRFSQGSFSIIQSLSDEASSLTSEELKKARKETASGKARKDVSRKKFLILLLFFDFRTFGRHFLLKGRGSLEGRC